MSDRDLYPDIDLADLDVDDFDQLAEYDLFFDTEPSDLAEDSLDEAPYLAADEMDDDER